MRLTFERIGNQLLDGNGEFSISDPDHLHQVAHGPVEVQMMAAAELGRGAIVRVMRPESYWSPGNARGA